jgi:hypothetical protein
MSIQPKGGVTELPCEHQPECTAAISTSFAATPAGNGIVTAEEEPTPCEAALNGIVQLLHCAYTIGAAAKIAKASSSFFMWLIFIGAIIYAQFSKFQHCMIKQKVAAYFPFFDNNTSYVFGMYAATILRY